MTMPDTGSGGTGTREQIRQVRDQVVDQAKSTFRDAKDRAGSSLADSRRQAADQIGSIAGAFHRTGEQLRNDNQERIAGLADSFAGQVEQVAQYLREADFRTIGRDVERLARERPAVVYGAAFAVGRLAARVLKSGGSSEGGRQADAWNTDADYERIRAGGDPAGLGGGDYSRGSMAGGFDASA
jgi:rhodanese-related sulfurtransferase